jgi:hypothetical protein
MEEEQLITKVVLALPNLEEAKTIILESLSKAKEKAIKIYEEYRDYLSSAHSFFVKYSREGKDFSSNLNNHIDKVKKSYEKHRRMTQIYEALIRIADRTIDKITNANIFSAYEIKTFKSNISPYKNHFTYMVALIQTPDDFKKNMAPEGFENYVRSLKVKQII